MPTYAPLRERLLNHCDRSGGPDACWPWTAALYNGYGMVGLGTPSRRIVGAHRAAYEVFVGPIPAGLTLDHVCHTHDTSCPGGKTCRHRRRINPSHLEPVANGANVLRGRGTSATNARKTVCVNGHPFNDQNTYRWAPPGDQSADRTCRECHRIAEANRRSRLRACR